jgi:hypothetical protein
MDKLMTCSRCGGFLGPDGGACPHCQAPPAPSRRRRVAVLLGLAGSASLGLTMMACYGGPPCTGQDKCAPLPDANGDTSGPDGGATN